MSAHPVGVGIGLTTTARLRGPATERHATHTFARDASEIARARRLAAATLRSWGVRVDQSAIVLLTSELMTNAIRHGEGVVRMVLRATDGRVRIEVHDAGAGMPGLRVGQLTGDGLGGFGLHVVAALADAWGVEHGAGTTVWAEKASTWPTQPDDEREPGPP